ncbi:MAG: hypothetical protein FWG43_00120 [Clostridiales bacterium]|nr:hypothetical protein [Clostridiales bacterium]
MKKTVIILLLLLAMLGSVIIGGCSKPAKLSGNENPAVDNSAAIDSAQQTAGEPSQAGDAVNTVEGNEASAMVDNDNNPLTDTGGKLAAAYIDILSGSNYYIKCRTISGPEDTGFESLTETAKSGDDFAIKTEVAGMTSHLVMKDGDLNIIDHESRSVMNMSGGMPGLNEGVLPQNGYTYLGSGTGKLFDSTYNYEEFTTDQGTVRFFFSGDKLAGAEYLIEDLVTQMEILEMSTAIPKGLFDIPASYDTSFINI